MSAVGTVRIIWDNGEDDFCLAKAGSIFALEDKCQCGIAEVLQRLHTRRWWLNDVRETIRLGLIGGGMDAEKAMRAVQIHVDGQPLAKSVLIAQAVLAAVLVGVPDDDVGKKAAAEAATQAPVSSTTTAASDAPRSTELAQG